MKMYELDQKSNEALENARTIHNQILEKEFEIKMKNINSKYSFNRQNMYLEDINNNYAVEMIELLKDKRDIYLSSAIFYALHTIEKSINKVLGNPISGSLSVLHLISISSFIIHNVKSFKISDSTKEYAIKISALLLIKGLTYDRTRVELQKILNVAYRQ